MEVSVVCSGQELTFAVSPQISVLSLKHLLSARTRIPVALQSLEVNGTTLADRKSLADYLSSKRKVIQNLDLHSQLPLNYRFSPLFGDPLTVSVLISDPLPLVREKVAGALGVESDSVRIAKRGKVLEEDQIVADWYEVGEFVLEVLLPEEFFARIKLEDGSVVSISAAPSLEIVQFLSRVSKLLCIDTACCCVRYKGMELPYDNTFSILDIRPNEYLSLSPLSARTVLAQSFTHGSFEIDIAEIKTVGELVHKVEARLGGTNSLDLLFRGKILKSTVSMESAGIVSGAILQFGEIIVHARTSNIEVATMMVSADVPISKLVTELASRLHLSTITLVYKGETLSESKLLSDYEIGGNVALEVLQPSGSYIWVKSASERIRIDIPDFSISVAELIRYFKALTGSMQEADCALYNGKTIELQQSLSCYRVSVGSVVRLFSTSREVVVSVSGLEKSHSFALLRTLSVGLLKWKIEKKWRIPSSKQRLFCQGSEIEGNQRVGNLPEPHIQLLGDRDKMIAFVNVETDQILYKPCAPNTSVLDLKLHLGAQWPITSQSFFLMWKKRVLGDTETLKDLTESTSVSIVVCKSGTCFLRLKSKSTRYFAVVPSFNISVSELKSMYSPLVLEAFSLYCKGVSMENEKLLANYSISLNSSVVTVGPKDVAITVRELSGTQKLFVLKNQQVVYDLMQEIQQKMGHYTQLQVLIAREQQVFDIQAPVSSLSPEVLVLHGDERYAFLVSRSQGTQIVYFEKNHTIRSLVQRIAVIACLSTKEFVLMCEDFPLKEVSNAKCEKIRNGSAIELFTSKDPVLIINLPSNTVVRKPILPMTRLQCILLDLNLPSDTSLYHNGVELDSSRTPEDYGLTACSELFALRTKQKLVQVFTLSHDVVGVIIDKAEYRAGKVIAAVSKSIGVPAYTLRLYCRGVHITENERIIEGRDLRVLTNSEVMIHACTLGQEKVAIALRVDQTVRDMRVLVAESLKRRPDSLRMIANSSLFDDDRKILSDTALREKGSVVVLEPGDLCVFVKGAQSCFHVASRCSDTVKKLITTIAMVSREIPTALVYEGQIMRKADTLQDYGIRTNATVHSLRKDDCLISLENQFGDGFLLKCQHPAFKLNSLRSEVTKQTGVPAAEQSFSCVSELLHNLRISDYRLPDSAELFLVCSQSVFTEQVRIIIKHSGRKIAQLQAESDCSICNLRKRVEEATGYVVSRLVLEGQVAADSASLADYYLSPKTSAAVVLASEYIAVVRVPEQSSFDLPIYNCMKVSDLKSQIEEVTGIPVALQQIYISENEQTGTELQYVNSDCVIDVRLTEELILIETLQNRRIPIIIPLNHSVLQLKLLIARELSLSTQRLFYRDEELRDERQLGSYGLQAGSIVVLVRPEEIRVLVKSVFGGFVIVTKRSAKVEEVKWEVAKRCGLRKEYVRLFAAFFPIQEEVFPSLYTAAVLHVRVCLHTPDILLLLRTAGDALTAVRASPGESVAALCAHTAAITQTENVGLVYRGLKLREELTVDECGLVSLTVLSLAEH